MVPASIWTAPAMALEPANAPEAVTLSDPRVVPASAVKLPLEIATFPLTAC